MDSEVTPELAAKYRELDDVIRDLARLEGIPDNAIVQQWAVVAGVVAFEKDGYMHNDVQVFTPNAGYTTPVWQVKGLLDTGLTKYRALETQNFLDCTHDGEEDGEEGN